MLPVVTQTPASVLLYTSFSSMTPCPFSCCGTHTAAEPHRSPSVCESHPYDLSCRTHHVYSAVLAVVDLVVPDNGTAVCPDLDSCQGIAIDVVSFDEASAVPEYINATLVAVENGVAPKSATKHISGHTSVSFAAPYLTEGPH